jgi:oligoendopeptidase F
MTTISGVKLPQRKDRTFLPNDFSISTWELIEPYFVQLEQRPLPGKEDLVRWLMDLDELQSVFLESQAWRYIQMTGNMANAAYEEAFNFFASSLEPKAAPYFNNYRKLLLASPFSGKLEKETFGIFLRSVKRELELYREENIPLLTQIDVMGQEYARIVGAITVVIRDKEMTLQQASNLFKSTDRTVREQTYRQIRELRLATRETLDALFDKLLHLRQQVAANAGFANYRDFSFSALGRFDYSPADCFTLHDAVAAELVPLVRKLDEKRKQTLGLDKLRPWDLDVDISGLPPLVPFANAEDLIEKTIACFNRIHPDFGSYLRIMNEMGHFDLDSRKDKAPGGYNYHLPETGVPFIFMNSVGSLRDLVTMVHEGGHAIHSFLCRELPLKDNKDVPAEIAELASMSMELISMEHWDVFLPNPEDLKRAKKEQLEKVLRALPWICLVDKFQHWVYVNPSHTHQERKAAWRTIASDFESTVIDWEGLEEGRESEWHKQLHIFEVPFYYIEYAFAQLGAIAVWRNYRKDPVSSLQKYREALSLGYTQTIRELYEKAGVGFDFSREYVKELAGFVKEELERLDA